MRQWTVDAFARRPFMGNPACVVEPFADWPEDSWMQALAAENNQAETAYLRTTGDPGRLELRWFTPTMEVPLCGHATLASAHVLYRELGFTGGQVAFQTRRSGVLTVRPTTRQGDGGYVMDFPADPPRAIAAPDGLAQALASAPLEVWSGQFLTVVLADEATVRGLSPDLAALASIGDVGAAPGNVIATALADPGRDYQVVSRVFAPGSGIPEDPATGSAHCILAPLFASKLDQSRIRFHQAYPGRGGDLTCEVEGGRVLIEGAAVTVLESRLRTWGPARGAGPLIEARPASASAGMTIAEVARAPVMMEPIAIGPIAKAVMEMVIAVAVRLRHGGRRGAAEGCGRDHRSEQGLFHRLSFLSLRDGAKRPLQHVQLIRHLNHQPVPRSGLTVSPVFAHLLFIHSTREKFA